MASRPKRNARTGSGRVRKRQPGAAEPPSLSAEAGHLEALYGHIYAVVRRIPRGRVATYGQVAELAGIPGGARVAAAAMRLSAELGLPWQRVVGKRSATTARVSILDPVGAGIQRALLEAEGVEFSDAGAISLARFGWLPAGANPMAPAQTRPPRARRPGSRRSGTSTGRSRR